MASSPFEGVATSHVKLGGVKTLHFFPHPKRFQFLQGKNFRMFRRTPFEMTVAIQILQMAKPLEGAAKKIVMKHWAVPFQRTNAFAISARKGPLVFLDLPVRANLTMNLCTKMVVMMIIVNYQL
jgi:hypothetical protein